MEATEEDIKKWIREDKLNTYPEEIAKQTFSKKVMDAICSDHHKSKDGILTICYDYFENRWYISHPGYCREAEAEGDTYLDAAEKFLYRIWRENDKILFRNVEDWINDRIPENYFVEVRRDGFSLFEVKKGEENLRVSVNRKWRTKEELLKMVKKEIKGEED